MKKAAILFVFLLFQFSLCAQEQKHEITLGGGLLSTSELWYRFAYMFFGWQEFDKTYSGAYHLGYKQYISSRVGVGGTFVFERIASDYMVDGVRQNRHTTTFCTLAPEAYYNYYRKGRVTLYALAGIGVAMKSDGFAYKDGGKNTDRVVYLNFQATPIGIKYGHKIGVFGELGVGYKGFVCVGLFGRF